jgi:hypothetical protein
LAIFKIFLCRFRRVVPVFTLIPYSLFRFWRASALARRRWRGGVIPLGLFFKPLSKYGSLNLNHYSDALNISSVHIFDLFQPPNPGRSLFGQKVAPVGGPPFNLSTLFLSKPLYRTPNALHFWHLLLLQLAILKPLFNPSRLPTSTPQIVEFSPANFPFPDHFNTFDNIAIKWENPLNSHIVGPDFPNGKGFTGSPSTNCDYHPFEILNPAFIPFPNLYRYSDGIPRSKFGPFLPFYLPFFELFDISVSHLDSFTVLASSGEAYPSDLN